MGLIAWIVIGAIVLLVSFAISIYSRLVRLRIGVDAAWSRRDVRVERGYVVTADLVETVRGHAARERETLVAVITARQQTAQAENEQVRAQAESMLTGALRQLF